MNEVVWSRGSLRKRIVGAILACGVGLLVSPGSAVADGPPPLPPEAYAACDGKSSGDGCTVTIHGSEVQGTCMTDREGSKLFCRLSDAPRPPEERH